MLAHSTESSLLEKFRGALLGAMMGDILGAVVEAESPGYIRKSFAGLDQILALKSVPEIFGGEWPVGRFTDDTQMTLGVTEWLLADETRSGKNLLEYFCRNYEPWRRYGSGTQLILETFPRAKEQWAGLATAMFPQGSYGNGSAMRVAPVGLLFHRDLPGLIEVARISSATTHSHYLAVQGAALQATAVAAAASGVTDRQSFLRQLLAALFFFEKIGQDVSVYKKALARMAEGLKQSLPPGKMSTLLGTGIQAYESVPMAIYCYLANADSYERTVGAAVFLGGDTDTLAAMAGGIAGAALGERHIPAHWLKRVRETNYTPAKIRELAAALYQQGASHNFMATRA